MTRPSADVDLVHRAFAALNFGVMEHIADTGAFTVHGAAPAWLTEVWPEFVPGRAVLRPQDRFPLVDLFLLDAREFWQAPAGPQLRSGPWEEHRADGSSLSMEAIALRLEDHHLLLIERLGSVYDEQKEILQRARETLLVKEQLEREIERRTRWIRDREEETVLRLAWAAEYRDGDTGAHIRRIGLIAAVMAEQLGWARTAVEDIRLAAPMHDVGKIGLPDTILLKPGPLSDDERQLMRTHTEIGARILDGSSVPLVRMAREIALSHHEWWNGDGYPSRLAGEAIPECGRIVSVADVYDALLHERVYRPAMPEEQVLAYLEAGRGSQFDPRALDAFLAVLPRVRRYRKNTPHPVYGGTGPEPSAG